MDEVEYRAVPGFPGYFISNEGRIWSLFENFGCRGYLIGTTSTEVFGQLTPSGYRSIGLHRDGKIYGKRIHRLVLEAFVGPCPPGMVAAHNDGNKINNRLDNLRWTTQKDNLADRVIHGTHRFGETHPRATITESDVVDIRRRHAAGETVASLAREYNVSYATVSQAANRKTWKHIA